MQMAGQIGKKRKPHRLNNIYPDFWGYIYVAPAIIMMLLMCLFPVFILIYNSFTDLSLANPNTNFVGLANFVEILTSRQFYANFGRTIIYVVSTVSMQLLLGFTLAFLFQVKFPLKRTARTFLILPMVATPVAMAFLWSIIFNPTHGVLNYFFSLLGISSQLWTASTDMALPSILMVDIWQNTPFTFLIFSSGLAALPGDPFEAASVDGASFSQLIRYILLPLMKPIFTVVLLLRAVDAFKVFDIIYTLTAGGPGTSTTTVNIMVYLNAFSYNRMGYASAMALIMYLLVLVLAYVIVRTGNMTFK